MFDFRKDKQFVERRWKDVRVGDFVKVFCNEIVCADLLLLHTSDLNGVCHLETANLDGETNLKQRRVVSGLCISVSFWEIFVFSFLPVFLLSSHLISPLSSVLPHLYWHLTNCMKITLTCPDMSLLNVNSSCRTCQSQ